MLFFNFNNHSRDRISKQTKRRRSGIIALLIPLLTPTRLVCWYLLLMFSLQSCYIQSFFQKKKGQYEDDTNGAFGGTVLGQTLGSQAGGLDEVALKTVYNVVTKNPPAALRPDPDLMVRRLLKQFRPDGVTLAYQIGQVEQYRMLLGGASTDFAKMPQDGYDATSLLAVYKVAEEVCRGLVAPNSSEHRGWSSILPFPPSSERENTLWLAQRIIGKPSQEIADSKISALIAIMAAEEATVMTNWWAATQPYSKYISVCATLALDAEALYF